MAADRDAQILSLADVVQHHAWGCSRLRPDLLEDLTSEAWLGAIQAVDAYDPTRGASLRTWASPRIRGSVLDWLRAHTNPASGMSKLVRRPADGNPRREWPADVDLHAPFLHAPGDPVEDLAAAHVDAQRVLAALDSRTAAMVAEHLGLGVPLPLVGARHGVDGSRVCQIVRAVVRSSSTAAAPASLPHVIPADTRRRGSPARHLTRSS